MRYSNRIRMALIAAAAVSTVAVAGCAGMTTGSNGTSQTMAGIGSTPVGNVGTNGSPSAADLSWVKSWSIRTARYLGKPAKIEDLAADTSDMLIVAPKEFATKDTPLDQQIAAIRGHNRKRVILALVNLGYVDPSSDLWDGSWLESSGKLSATAPDWLTPVAGDSSRFPIRYWENDWLTRVEGDVDRLRKAGFDGVCVDGLGAYTGFLPDRPTGAVDMATVIETVARKARAHAANFLIVPIDDHALIDKLTDKQRTDYVKVVDAVVGENVFYHGNKAADNDLDPQTDVIDGLDRYQYAGKPVFVIDNVAGAGKVADFQERAKARGYVPSGPAGETSASATSTNASTTSATASAGGS